jgi:hypothetical protein
MPIAALDSPLIVDQGADFIYTVTYESGGLPVNLTGYTATWQWSGENSFTPANLTPGSGLTLNANGTINVLVPGEVTATWTFEGISFWLMLTDTNGGVQVLLSGKVTVNELC